MNKHPVSFRGVFIFNTTGNLEISQRFSTVEMRLQKNRPHLPPNDKITQIFQEKVLPEIKSEENFVFNIDYMMDLVVLPTKNDYIAVIPFIESNYEQGKPFVEIAASFHFLSFLEPIFRTPLKNYSKNQNPAPIIQIINLILPFGTPVIHDAYFMSQLPTTNDSHLFNAGYQTVSPHPVPSWKTYLVFPRQQLDVKVRETIVCSIDGDKTLLSVFGELRSIAQINYLPVVTIQLKGYEKMKDICSHYCVKEYKDGKLLLSPPTGITQLLLWRSELDQSLAEKPPITGSYTAQSQPDNGISFTLTVTTNNPTIKSVFIQLPFPDRGTLNKHQFQTNPQGSQIKMSKKESTIGWSVELTEGSATLTGSLNFEKPCSSQERLKAFVDFKSKNSTYSGISIDESSVVSTASGATVTVENSYSSETKKYIIWGPSLP